MTNTEWIATPENWTSLKYHPLSEIVSFGAGIDLAGLAQHMETHGYDDAEPIVLFRDQILDGRHKHAAALVAGVTPSFVRFVGKSAEAYVAKKAFRQHLNASQRAMIAATMAKHPSGVIGKNHKSANLPTSNEQAASSLNVSERSVRDAKKVLNEGSPELQAAVMEGTVSVSDAAKVATEPPAAQRKAVDAVKSGKSPTATKAAPKSGKPRFDEKKFEKAYGQFLRVIDERAAAMGKDAFHKQLLDKMDEVLAIYKEWRKAS